MLFSIIIPIYNVEKYLAQCIDSVLAQSFTDYELILVDDGSTDNSGKICDEYQAKYSKIKVIHKSNGGQATARNVGTSEASGDYILYIDSDDYIVDNNFLTDISKVILSEGCELILYKFRKFTDGSNVLEPCYFSLADIKFDDCDRLLLELVERDAYYGSPWIKAIKRNLLIENRIEFENGLLGEDMDWSCNLLTKTKTISVVDKSYIAYRQRPGSVSKTNKLKNLTDFIYILEKWSVFIENAELSDIRKRALRGILAKYYANMLITYLRVNDPTKREYISRIKKLSSLLNYGMSKRPMVINKAYKIIGFNGTIAMLKILDKVKH